MFRTPPFFYDDPVCSIVLLNSFQCALAKCWDTHGQQYTSQRQIPNWETQKRVSVEHLLSLAVVHFTNRLRKSIKLYNILGVKTRIKHFSAWSPLILTWVLVRPLILKTRLIFGSEVNWRRNVRY